MTLAEDILKVKGCNQKDPLFCFSSLPSAYLLCVAWKCFQRWNNSEDVHIGEDRVGKGLGSQSCMVIMNCAWKWICSWYDYSHKISLVVI